MRTVAGNESGGFNGKFAALLKASEAKPFGDATAMAQAARDLAGWADSLAKSLDQGHYNQTNTVQLRRQIAEAARRKPGKSNRGLDYDDAQQLLWAFDALRDEGTPVPDTVVVELAKLAGPAKSDTPMLGRLYDPRINPRPLIAELLPYRLRRVSQYQPEVFSEAFEKIAARAGAAGR